MVVRGRIRPEGRQIMDKRQPEGAPSPRGHEAAISHQTGEEDRAAQRRYPRIKCFIAVQMRPESDHGLVLGNLSDVSLGGCGVEGANHVGEGTQVALCPLTAAGELWVKGVVANSRFSEGTGSFHLGVRFLEECPASLDHNIQGFVDFVEQAATRQNSGGGYRKMWGL
jgi:hypothetical protein